MESDLDLSCILFLWVKSCNFGCPNNQIRNYTTVFNLDFGYLKNAGMISYPKWFILLSKYVEISTYLESNMNHYWGNRILQWESKSIMGHGSNLWSREIGKSTLCYQCYVNWRNLNHKAHPLFRTSYAQSKRKIKTSFIQYGHEMSIKEQMSNYLMTMKLKKWPLHSWVVLFFLHPA